MKTLVYLVLILVVTVASFAAFYNFQTGKVNLKLGLDLRSGSHLTVQLLPVKDPSTGKLRAVDQGVIKQTIQVVERRLNPQGNREIILQPEGTDRLVVEIPEETDVAKAERALEQAAYLEFKEQFFNPRTKQMEWRTVLDGTALTRTYVSFHRGENEPVVAFELTKRGAKEFAEITERNVSKPLGIFLDGQEISSPEVKEPITGGSGIIEGSYTVEKATEMVNWLNAGALPVKIKVLSSLTVSPTLGRESLLFSLYAGFIGLFLVVLFMIWYYRVPGLLADVALVVYTVVVLGTMQVMGFVLTLPGIAGFVLSIGMAVDANILIFERLKEELWADKSLRSAVEIGFKRAFSSILDSHVTTLIGAAVLFYFGSSSIKGFGLTLMVGTIISFVTATFVTRVFVDLLVENNVLMSRRLFGE